MSPEFEVMQDRAFMLAQARSFFHERDILEVDCPHLVSFPSLDRHIDLFQVEDIGFLHSSPEYAMKKVLTLYKKDIYQLGHVFRKEEGGNYHLKEFTMAEWYRIHFSFSQMMEETISFISLFLGNFKVEKISYKEAFSLYTDLDPFSCSVEKLQQFVAKNQIECSLSKKDDLLDLILAYFIEPKLGNGIFTILYDYPKNQAALAKIKGEVANRFEIYFKGVELANGYEEENNPDLIRKRMIDVNQERISYMQKPLPIDEAFLQEIAHMPPCCGVSVGFDRLMMLRRNKQTIQEISYNETATATFAQ